MLLAVPPRISNNYAGNTCITYFLHKLQLMYVFVHKLQLNIIYSLCHKYVHKLQLMYKVPHTRIFCIRLLILGGTVKVQFQTHVCKIRFLAPNFSFLKTHISEFSVGRSVKVSSSLTLRVYYSYALYVKIQTF